MITTIRQARRAALQATIAIVASVALPLAADAATPSVTITPMPPTSTASEEAVQISYQHEGGSNLVVEGGRTDSMRVGLSVAPTQTVRVTLRPVVAGQVSLHPNVVAFTPSNWRPQAVKVIAVDDDTFEQATNVSVSASVQFAQLGSALVGVATPGPSFLLVVGDNDSPFMVRQSQSPLRVRGTARSALYTISLVEPPTSKVTIKVRSPKGLRVSRKALTFTPGNWMIPQTILVSSQPRARGTKLIRHQARTSDAHFHRATLASVKVKIGG